MPYDYVLGDAPPEAERLRRQAALWDPETDRLLDRAGIAPGSRLLEIGPGAGSVHMALRRRVKCAVDAVERSPVFAEALRDATRADGFGAGRIWCGDLLDAELPAASYDVIFARWVFCFLPEPGQHLAKLAAALKPGGRVVIQDYAHREAFALFPRPAAWLDFLAADRDLFASQGGDASICGRLPKLMAAAGLAVTDVVPVARSGPPGSEVWNWLWEYFLSIRERYARMAPLTPESVGAIETEWRAAAANPHAFINAPLVVGLIAARDAIGPRA